MKSHLKYYRKRAGLSQEQLASKTRFSVSTIASMENGRRDGSVDTIIYMASFFGVTVDELLFGPSDSNSTNKQSEEVS
ncbi:helix-turn-helix transcriptional regulator [Levilactobacillus brevis]